MEQVPPTDPLDDFLDQFEWDDTQPIYRADRTGPAYRVTLDEYHDFIDAFERRRRTLFWITLLGVAVMLAILFVAVPGEVRWRNPLPGDRIFAAVLPLITSVTAFLQNRWLSHVPARALRGRAPIGPGLSAIDRLVVETDRVGWRAIGGQMAWVGMAAVIGLASGVASMAGTFWCSMAIVSLASPAVQIARKWRLHGLRAGSHVASSLT